MADSSKHSKPVVGNLLHASAHGKAVVMTMPKQAFDTLQGAKPERGEWVKVYGLMQQDWVMAKWTGKRFVDKGNNEVDATWWKREI